MIIQNKLCRLIEGEELSNLLEYEKEVYCYISNRLRNQRWELTMKAKLYDAETNPYYSFSSNEIIILLTVIFEHEGKEKKIHTIWLRKEQVKADDFPEVEEVAKLVTNGMAKLGPWKKKNLILGEV